MNRSLPSVLLRSAVALVCAFAGLSASAQSLPRVLMIGDSVYQNPVRSVAKDLSGRAEVVLAALPPGQPPTSTATLEHLDTLLGTGKWDLIHFNCGLGDLTYRLPGMKSFRAYPKHAGGVRTTNPGQYESNLRELAKRLKATGSKVVWASTTPIRTSPADLFDLGSEIEYNAIAARVMSANGIPTNDMYAHVKGVIDMTKPAPHGWDPFHFDDKPIHEPVVNTIRRQLNLK